MNEKEAIKKALQVLHLNVHPLEFFNYKKFFEVLLEDREKLRELRRWLKTVRAYQEEHREEKGYSNENPFYSAVGTVEKILEGKRPEREFDYSWMKDEVKVDE